MIAERLDELGPLPAGAPPTAAAPCAGCSPVGRPGQSRHHGSALGSSRTSAGSRVSPAASSLSERRIFSGIPPHWGPVSGDKQRFRPTEGAKTAENRAGRFLSDRLLGCAASDLRPFLVDQGPRPSRVAAGALPNARMGGACRVLTGWTVVGLMPARYAQHRLPQAAPGLLLASRDKRGLCCTSPSAAYARPSVPRTMPSPR